MPGLCNASQAGACVTCECLPFLEQLEYSGQQQCNVEASVTCRIGSSRLSTDLVVLNQQS